MLMLADQLAGYLQQVCLQQSLYFYLNPVMIIPLYIFGGLVVLKLFGTSLGLHQVATFLC